MLDGQGKDKVCPKCKRSDGLETYMSAGGIQQMCSNCGWTSEDKFEYEMVF